MTRNPRVAEQITPEQLALLRSVEFSEHLDPKVRSAAAAAATEIEALRAENADLRVRDGRGALEMVREYHAAGDAARERTTSGYETSGANDKCEAAIHTGRGVTVSPKWLLSVLAEIDRLRAERDAALGLAQRDVAECGTATTQYMFGRRDEAESILAAAKAADCVQCVGTAKLIVESEE